MTLWVDVDAKDFPGGKEEALASIKNFPLPPTLIVDSGHGFHCYWLFKESEEISGTDDIDRIESHLKALASALGGDLKSAELARVLRVPGTQNLKDPLNPVAVSLVEFEPSRRYNLCDFRAFLIIEASKQNASQNKPGWVADALADLEVGNRNGTFAKIAGKLRREGWEADDIVAVLRPHAEKCVFPLDELKKEVEGICGRYPPANTFPSSPYNGEATETELKPFQAVSLSELLEGTDEDVEWLIDRILSKEAVGILAGPAGYGKSWMLLDLVIEAAQGGKWLGHFQTQKVRVLYIDEESSRSLIKKRLRKLARAKGLQEKDLEIFFVVGQGLCFSDEQSIKRLRGLLDGLRPAIVVIDSLIRVHRAEENSATDMARVFSEVKEIVRDYGCSILFSDHQKKPGNFGVSLDLLLRGSTEKAAFVDTLLSLKRKDDSLIVEHSKSRFAEAVPHFVVRIEDPTPESTVVSYLGEAEALKQESRDEEACEFLRTVLGIEWVSRKILIERAKEAEVSEKALDAALKRLETEGVIERMDQKSNKGRGGKAALYRRKENPSPSREREIETETE